MNSILIIVAMMMAGSTDGGTSLNVIKMDFPTLASCQSAREFVQREGSMWTSASRGGIYKITAQCLTP